MVTPKQFPRLLVRRLGGRNRNIMATPDKRTAVLDQRFRRVGVRQDDNIEPTPYPHSVSCWCAFVMRGGEELNIFDLRDYICCQDLKWHIKNLNKKRQETKQLTGVVNHTLYTCSSLVDLR